MTRQVRVFGPVFEATAAKRVALDVHARAEDYGDLLLNALFGHASPTWWMSSGFQELDRPAAGGKQVAGTQLFRSTSPVVAELDLRRPWGPSVII